jgi:hypothetical protein
VGRTITNTYTTLCFLYRALHNNAYISYTCIINETTLSTTVPVLGRQNVSEMNPINLEITLQHFKFISPNNILLRDSYCFTKYVHIAATLLSGF